MDGDLHQQATPYSAPSTAIEPPSRRVDLKRRTPGSWLALPEFGGILPFDFWLERFDANYPAMSEWPQATRQGLRRRKKVACPTCEDVMVVGKNLEVESQSKGVDSAEDDPKQKRLRSSTKTSDSIWNTGAGRRGTHKNARENHCARHWRNRHPWGDWRCCPLSDSKNGHRPPNATHLPQESLAPSRQT